VGLQNFTFWACITPCLIYMTYGSTRLDWSILSSKDGEVDWVLMGSLIIWMYSGFASLGVLAGEIKNPKRTFIYGLMILLPMVMVVNTLPLAVAISQDSDRSHYIFGYFSKLAGMLLGPWLKHAFTFGATISFLGIYNGQIVIANETLAFLIEQNMKDTCCGMAYKNAVWQWLLVRPIPNGTRRLYIIVNAMLTSILLRFGVKNLLKVEMVVYAMCETLFAVSFFVLQMNEKHKAAQEALGESLFLVPKGILASCYLALPILLNVCYIILSVFEDYRKIVVIAPILICALIVVCFYRK